MRLICFLLLLAPLPASAEIVFTGEARMGLAFDGESVQATSGLELTARAYGVTDGGLEYGAVLDFGDGQSRLFNDDPPRSYVYIQGGNHSLKMGSGVNSAAREVMGTLPKVGP